MAMMTYPATVQFLYGLQQHGIGWVGDDSRVACPGGDPHRGYPVVHIGGTNGKGSGGDDGLDVAGGWSSRGTLHVTASGRFSRTHPGRRRQRFRKRASVRWLRSCARRRRLIWPRPFFEFTTALAVDILRSAGWMWRCSSDWVGRSDATNVVTPLASAIASIGPGP